MNTFNNWFQAFLEEKDLPYASWELTDNEGVTNFIDSDVVIESIKNTSTTEQSKIKDILVKIDFMNGDVNHFFQHLASALVNA